MKSRISEMEDCLKKKDQAIAEQKKIIDEQRIMFQGKIEVGLL